MDRINIKIWKMTYIFMRRMNAFINFMKEFLFYGFNHHFLIRQCVGSRYIDFQKFVLYFNTVYERQWKIELLWTLYSQFIEYWFGNLCCNAEKSVFLMRDQNIRFVMNTYPFMLLSWLKIEKKMKIYWNLNVLLMRCHQI